MPKQIEPSECAQMTARLTAARDGLTRGSQFIAADNIGDALFAISRVQADLLDLTMRLVELRQAARQQALQG